MYNKEKMIILKKNNLVGLFMSYIQDCSASTAWIFILLHSVLYTKAIIKPGKPNNF